MDTAREQAIALLKQQLTLLIELEALLMHEREVLTKHQPDKLNEVTQSKNTLLLTIDSIDKQLAQSADFVNNKTEECFNVILLGIEETLTHCQELNTVNGQIIQQSNLAVERMKTSLLQQHNKSSMTYDSKGKTHGGLTGVGIKA